MIGALPAVERVGMLKQSARYFCKHIFDFAIEGETRGQLGSMSSVDSTKTASSRRAGGVSNPNDNETKADNLSMQLSLHGLQLSTSLEEYHKLIDMNLRELKDQLGKARLNPGLRDPLLRLPCGKSFERGRRNRSLILCNNGYGSSFQLFNQSN